jgi:hypothetical protein
MIRFRTADAGDDPEHWVVGAETGTSAVLIGQS